MTSCLARLEIASFFLRHSRTLDGTTSFNVCARDTMSQLVPSVMAIDDDCRDDGFVFSCNQCRK